ncbi:MAG: bifunctional chorismate mutase/prephenate dehydrogenase [Thermosynechococcaceae cyanobacterium]
MSANTKLQQIDQALIDLLSQRIALLAETDVLDRQHQLEASQSQLAQRGVPEFLWESVITGCIAALAEVKPVNRRTATRKIILVGGRGMMGQFFNDRLTVAGHEVNILDRSDWSNAGQIVADVDLVLLCVPLGITISTIQKLAPYLSPQTTLADIASVKTPMVKAMLKAHPGPVLGLHPMFGPGVDSFRSQKIVVCPGRDCDACRWLLDLMIQEGGDLITCKPEEHDQIMITIQAIRHFSTFSLGVFLAEEGTDVSRSLEFSSPIYRIGINMISRLFAQNGELYVDIMLASSECREAIYRLSDTYQRLATLVESNDRTALIHEFIQARRSFEPGASQAMKESNHLINSLGTFLVADAIDPGSHCACP